MATTLRLSLQANRFPAVLTWSKHTSRRHKTVCATAKARGTDIVGSRGLEEDSAPIQAIVTSSFQYAVRRPKATGHPVQDFITKVQLAWRIFFPDKPKDLSPKEEVKRRLKMVLVADRCGMSPASLDEMKKTIVKALESFVDIEGAEDGIEVAITTDPGLGTVYSVNIPIRRVKAETRFASDFEGAALAQGITHNGITLEWDSGDYDADPSARFPMGC